MRNLIVFSLCIVFTIGLIGCGGDGAGTLSPEQLGKLGAQINENPENAESILKEHDLTLEEFKKKVQRVTEDPDQSKRYSEAFQREQDRLN